jgi:hypothetical protein
MSLTTKTDNTEEIGVNLFVLFEFFVATCWP